MEAKKTISEEKVGKFFLKQSGRYNAALNGA